jgi:hypothetical protein
MLFLYINLSSKIRYWGIFAVLWREFGLSGPVLPDLCKPSRPALPLTLLVYGGDREAQAQLNLRSGQPKSLSQYLYSSKKMVLITHGHFCGNFPQPDIFLYCRFWVIRPWPRPSGNPAPGRYGKERSAGQYRRAQGQVGMGAGGGGGSTYGTAERSVYSWKEGTLVW